MDRSSTSTWPVSDSDLALRRRQRLHWDRIAEAMPDLFPLSTTQYYRNCEIALIRRAFGTLAGKRVLKLDLWNEAVNTRILNWMAAQGARCSGLDASRSTTGRAGDNARANADALNLVQADIRDVPFRDDSFDFVYTMGTIEHIDEYAQALAEIHRVLRPGGKAIIGVPWKWDLWQRPLLVYCLQKFDKYPYSPEKAFGAGELRRDVERAGLRVLERTGILSLPGIVRMFDVFLYRRQIFSRRLVPFTVWPFERVETRWRWPGYLGYLVAVVAEKQVRATEREE